MLPSAARVSETCALQLIYATWIGSSIPTFRNKLSVPSSDDQTVLWIGSMLSTFRNKLSVPSSDDQAVLWIVTDVSGPAVDSIHAT